MQMPKLQEPAYDVGNRQKRFEMPRHNWNTMSLPCVRAVRTSVLLEKSIADESSGIRKPNRSQEILQALQEARWNKIHAALLLGISRRTIYHKTEDHNMLERMKNH